MTLETVEQIAALLAEHPVSEIVLEREGFRVVARRSLVPSATATAAPSESDEPGPTIADTPEETPAEAAAPEPLLLTAGMVGLFRHADPPLGYGGHVVVGQLVGSIEAMKVLNDVRAEFGGQVVDIFAEEGAPVEYGQSLFRLLPE